MTRNTPPRAHAKLLQVRSNRETFKQDYDRELRELTAKLDAEFRARRDDYELQMFEAREYGASVRELCEAYGSTDRRTIYTILSKFADKQARVSASLDAVYSWGNYTIPDYYAPDGRLVTDGFEAYGLIVKYIDHGPRHLTVDDFYVAREDDVTFDWTFRSQLAPFLVDGKYLEEIGGGILHDAKLMYYQEANAWAKAHREKYQLPQKVEQVFVTDDKWGDA